MCEMLRAHKDIVMYEKMLAHGLPVKKDEQFVRACLADARSRFRHAWEKAQDVVAAGILADIRLGR